MRQAKRDSEIRLITPKLHRFRDEGRPARVGDHIIGRPEPAAGAALLELNLAAGLDVDDGAGGEGQRDVGIKRKPQARLVLGGREQEAS